MATLPQAAHSAAGQEHRLIKCGPITAGSRHGDYADPYGDGQPLPKAPRRQLTKQILAELNSAAPDAIQGEADGFPYHGGIRARNALFLDTELRTPSEQGLRDDGDRPVTIEPAIDADLREKIKEVHNSVWCTSV